MGGPLLRWRVHKLFGRWRVEFVGVNQSNFVSIAPNGFGRINCFSQRGMDGPYNLFERLQKEVLPAAKSAVPSYRGSYGAKGSEHRMRLCDAIATALNAREIFPRERRDAVSDKVTLVSGEAAQ